MAKGTIKKLMDKGFGFISAGGEEDLFFHRNSLEGVEFGSLFVGQGVEFEMGQDSKGRPQAVKVRLAETQVDDGGGDGQGGDDQGGDDQGGGEDEV